MLFFKVSLSLCYFVQPFLHLLSTIIVCNMNLVKRNMLYFKQLLRTVLESQAHTQNHNNINIQFEVILWSFGSFLSEFKRLPIYTS